MSSLQNSDMMQVGDNMDIEKGQGYPKGLDFSDLI